MDYSVKRDGASVTVAFDKGGSVDLSPATKASLRNIRNVEQFRQPNGALAVTFAVPQDAEVKDSRNGKSVVLDVLNAGTRKGVTPPAASPPATTTTVRPEPVPPVAPGAAPSTPPPSPLHRRNRRRWPRPSRAVRR